MLRIEDSFGLLRRVTGCALVQDAWKFLNHAHKVHQDASGVPCTLLGQRARTEFPDRCRLITCPSSS